MAEYSGPAELIPEGGDVSYRVTVRLRTEKRGHRTAWSGSAVPADADIHPITPGYFEIRLPSNKKGRVVVEANMRTVATTRGGSIAEGATTRQHFRIYGNGEPPF